VLCSPPVVRGHSVPSTGKLQAAPVRPSCSSPLPPTVIDPNNGREMDDTYTRINPETNLDVWVLPLIEATSSDRKPLAFLQTKFNESQGQLSPDSHWMAYTSDESGQREVYVRPFPPGDGWWRISTAGGEQPRWRGDGKELFYAAANGKMTAVPVKALLGSKPSFEPGVPIPLFDSHMLSPGTTINDTFQYDVTADGKRFLVVTNGDGAASSPPLTMWVNWTAGLKR